MRVSEIIEETMEALSDLRVVEVGGDVACSYAAKLLADLGAEVLKIEPPGGDALRWWGPFPGGQPDPERSGLFRYLNANKKSLVLDLSARADLERLSPILAGADLLVESGPAPEIDARGLDALARSAGAERLAVVRISPFGMSGPYRDLEATDLVIQAAGGWVSAHGLPGSDAVRVGGRIPEYLAGSFAASSGLTAVRAARDRGEIVDVDVSIMECLIGTLPYPMLWADTLRRMGMPPPQKRRTPLPGVLRCKDGWVGVNVLTAQQWADTCALFEVPQFIDDQKDIQSDLPIAGEFFAAIQPWLDAHAADEIVTLGQAFRIPMIWIGRGDTLEEFEQFRERPFYVDEPGERWRRPGFPYRLGRTPARIRSAAPVLEARSAAGGHVWPERDDPVVGVGARRPHARTDVEALPFRDLKILDLGTFWAGPFVTMYFASQGAEVLKVESIQRPDGFRFSQTYPQLGEDYYEHSSTYQGSNHGKRNLTLDLRNPRARELFLELVADADVVIENFSPRVMENFGLDYETLCTARPDLILVRMPGFGLEGPWRDYVGWATVIEQASGMTWVTGHPDGPPLNPGGFIDCGVSMHVGVALQAALAHRERTGEGQHIEVAQLETGACLTPEQIIDHSMNGVVQGRHGNRDTQMAPQGVYASADDSWVALSIRDDREWQGLTEILGNPDWARDPGLATLAGRRARHDDLDREIGAWIGSRAAALTVSALRSRRIPAAEALVATKMYGEPQLEARGYYQEMEHPRSGLRRYPTWPMRFSYGPDPAYGSVAPTLGQHNASVLREELGLSEKSLEELAAASIIGEKMSI